MALGAWTVLVPPGGLDRALPAGGAVAAAACCYAVGRLASVTVPLRSSVAVAIAFVAGTSVVLTPGGLSGGATAPPLGYGNANGAVVTLALSAVLVVALSGKQLHARLLGVASAVALVPVAWLTGSRSATVVSAALVVVGAGLAVRPTLGRPLPVLGALGVLAAFATTTALALSGPEANRVQEALSYRRVTLWAESVAMVEQSPWRGRGVGSFAVEAPSAQDRDVRWSHSLWLQQAAETGLPGLALLLAAAGTVLLRVRADGWEDGGVPALGAAIVAAMLVHGSVDYVFHFPAVVGGTALLAGLTVAPRRL